MVCSEFKFFLLSPKMFSHDEMAQVPLLLVPACQRAARPSSASHTFHKSGQGGRGGVPSFPPREILRENAPIPAACVHFLCSQLTVSEGRASARGPWQPSQQGRALPSIHPSIHPPAWVSELRVANQMLWMSLSPLALAPAEVQGDSLEEATFNL